MSVYTKPLRVVARSNACTVFYSSNTGKVGLNPTRAMDICLPFILVFVLSCVSRGLPTGRSPFQGVLPNVFEQDSEPRKREALNHTGLSCHAREEEEQEEEPNLNILGRN
jgi:hypothetical protein